MSNKDYINKEQSDERRFFSSPVSIEKRSDEGTEITGIAAKVNSVTDIGWFREMIMPRAFDEVLNDDIRCLFNHDPNQILARSNGGKGTLSLSVTNEGHLAYSYSTPKRSFAIDLEDSIDKGDVTQSSFAFRVKEEAWEYAQNDSETDLRKIIKFEKIYDVSPVTYPAYQDTSVAKRSYDNNKPETRESSAPKFDGFSAQFMFNSNKYKNENK